MATLAWYRVRSGETPASVAGSMIKALQYLSQAVEFGYPKFLINSSPDLTTLKEDPDFAVLTAD